MRHDILSGRTVSAFNLSVGTSLALESIFSAENPSIDPNRIIPQKINISDYQELWVNLSTLFRNILGSLSKEDSNRVLYGELAHCIDYEVELIDFITKTQSNNGVKVIYYANNYQDLQSTYPLARVRTDNTTNQKIYRALHNQAIQSFLSNVAKSANIRSFKNKIKNTNRPKALMLTHMPYDLLSKDQFSTLHLLESHTGLLKTPATWYHKYYDGKNLPPMPFNEGLLQVFGDKESFSVLDIKLKKELIELIKERKWTPATSVSNMKNDIERLKNPYFVTILKKLL